MKRLYSILLALFCALLTCELVLNLFFIRIPEQKLYGPFGYKPVEGSSQIQSEEGFGFAKYNNYGLQGGNLFISSKEDKILFLGDSHTEALQVMEKERYVNVFERKLKQLNRSYSFSTINASYAGASVADYIYLGEEYLKTFNPQIVFIQVTYDDFYKDAIKPDNIFKIIKDQNELKIKFEGYDWGYNKYKNNSVYRYLRRSALFKLFYKKAAELKSNIEEKINAHSDQKQGNEIKTSTSVQADYKEYNTYTSWCIKSLKEKYKKKLVLIYLPYTPKIQDNKVTTNLEEEYRKSIIKACTDNDIKLIDFTDKFNNLYLKKNLFPRGVFNMVPGEGHLNSEGHQIVGTYVAEMMEELTK